MRMHCIQHVPYEDMAGIETWAKSKGHSTGRTLLFKGEELPLLGSFDWLVVMGGPMSAGDEAKYPWLKAEKRFIRSAVATGKIVLGVCLGAQLLAEAMGGTVQKNRHKEIGWYPVSLTEDAKAHPIFQGLPPKFMAFHWHGDTFIPPPAARRIAFSEACGQQAFEIGRAVGLQFHLECTKENIERLIENCSGDLVKGPFVQDVSEIRAGYGNLTETGELLSQLLDDIEKEYGRAPD
jgi:GMP synthase-like glutamine amidotransferase